MGQLGEGAFGPLRLESVCRGSCNIGILPAVARAASPSARRRYFSEGGIVNALCRFPKKH
jgi:hypothetical protein